MNQQGHTALGADASAVSVNRSLILMALGAVVGLSLAGYSLFTARGTSTLYVPPEDVALVNQQPVSRIDYLMQLQALYSVDLLHSNPAQRQKVLDDMIREELFVQRGKELDVATSDSEVRSAMVNAVELEIAADAISSQPDDVQLQAYYQSNTANYASEGIMTVKDYVSEKPSADAVTAMQDALRKGPPTLDSLSHLNFKQARTDAGEEYYFAAKIHLGETLFKVARNMTAGEVSKPIAMPDGLHLLYIEKNQQPVLQSFATVRNQVLGDFRKTAIARLRLGDEGYLRKRANILIADDMRQ